MLLFTALILVLGVILKRRKEVYYSRSREETHGILSCIIWGMFNIWTVYKGMNQMWEPRGIQECQRLQQSCYHPGSQPERENRERLPGRRRELNMLAKASSCARCTVRPNKPKRWSLEQRKVYYGAKQGDGVFVPLLTPNSLKGFSKASLKVR